MSQLHNFKALLTKELNFESGGNLYIESTKIFISHLHCHLIVVVGSKVIKKTITFDVDNYYSSEALCLDFVELFNKAKNKEGRYNLSSHQFNRYFVYEEDVVRAIIKATRNVNNWGQIVDIGADAKITLEELFDLVREEANWKLSVVTRSGNDPYEEVPSKINSLLDKILEKRLLDIFKNYKPQ